MREYLFILRYSVLIFLLIGDCCVYAHQYDENEGIDHTSIDVVLKKIDGRSQKKEIIFGR